MARRTADASTRRHGIVGPASVWSAHRRQPAGKCPRERFAIWSRTDWATRRRVMLASADPTAGATGSEDGSSQGATGSPAPEPQPLPPALSAVAIDAARWD